MTFNANSSVAGIEFWKMSGSGNDFVVLDGRAISVERGTDPHLVRQLAARQEGIGADGVVLLVAPSAADVAVSVHFQMIYCNADGTRAEMCGNAALCSTALAAEWGMAPAEAMRFRTDSGIVSARIRDGLPEIDLAPVHEVRHDAGLPLEPGEHRIGFATVGVPHLVVLCEELHRIDVADRGARLRHDASLPAGANVNFVEARPDGRFDLRTFERGVEAETLACGTGATASAILLTDWGACEGPTVRLVTLSGMELAATPNADGGAFSPSLRGSARVVFTGQLR